LDYKATLKGKDNKKIQPTGNNPVGYIYTIKGTIQFL